MKKTDRQKNPTHLIFILCNPAAKMYIQLSKEDTMPQTLEPVTWEELPI